MQINSKLKSKPYDYQYEVHAVSEGTTHLTLVIAFAVFSPGQLKYCRFTFFHYYPASSETQTIIFLAPSIETKTDTMRMYLHGKFD